MRICLDECLDWRLARHLPGHFVRSVSQMGWSSAENGALLALMAPQFDVFLTVDKNLPHQQAVEKFSLAIFVLNAKRIRPEDMLPLVPALLRGLDNTVPGTVTGIDPP